MASGARIIVGPFRDFLGHPSERSPQPGAARTLKLSADAPEYGTAVALLYRSVLRTIFVITLAVVGFAYALQGAFYALLLYLWVAYFRPESWVWDGVLQDLNLSYIAGVWLVVMAFLSRSRWSGGLRLGLLLLFLAHTAISAFLAQHAAYAWPFWLEYLKVVIVTCLIVALTTNARQFRLVLLTIALSLGFESAKQGWLGLILHPGSVNMNTHALLGDNNGVAVGMMMLAPVFMMLASTANTRTERYLHRFLCLGVLYRGISTYSRGGFLACAAMGLVYILRSPRRVPALAGILTVSLIIVPVLPKDFWDRIGTITSVEDPDDPDRSALGRLHFWDTALVMANANPIFGIGHHAFQAEYNQYDDSGGKFGSRRAVHSVWFGLLAELGYPGLILFLAQLLLAFRACALARRAARVSPANAILGRFALMLEASLIAYVVGGTFLTFQYLEMYWHFVGLSIALYVLARNALASGVTVAGTAPAIDLPGALELAS
jgi:putative inorganic carbon (HCO3(-)) transporter